MQSGEVVTSTRGDSGATTWRVESELGRGLWGRSFAVLSPDGTRGVLKAPLTNEDLAGSPDAGALAAACAAACDAVRRDLEGHRLAHLPRLLGAVTLPDGRPAYVVPRYASTLESRLSSGLPLSEAIDLVTRILHRLDTSGVNGLAHGNLRPSNIMLDANDEISLADAIVPALVPARAALEKAAGRSSYLPPEASGAPRASWDTWALCVALWRASCAPGVADDGVRRLDLPAEGLGRVQLATLKDAAVARLRAEHVITRFATKATTRLGAIIERALSGPATPSPPYRFDSVAELRTRLVEVHELIHPMVQNVSKVMLGAAAREGIFEGAAQAEFSVNVATTSRVEAEEDIAVGLLLRDLDAQGDGRVRIHGSRFTVEKYPSGRFRFNFTLPDVPPGRYQIRVAFSIKDSRGESAVAEGQFEVRPRPGYVPPPAPVEMATAIPMPARHTPAYDADGGDASGDVVAFGANRRPTPRPIAPPSDEPLRPLAVVEPEPSTYDDDDAFPSSFAPEPRRAHVPIAAAPPTPVASFQVQATAVSTPPTLPSISLEPYTSPSMADDLMDLPPSKPHHADYGFQDYAPPAPAGGDLPAYDVGDEPESARWFDSMRDTVLGYFQNDPLSASFVSGAMLFVLIVLVSSLRSC